MFPHGPRQAICVEKPLEMLWVVPRVEWGGTSRNHQCGAKNVSQVDGDSDMVPACWLCGERAQQMNNGLCQYFCLEDSCPSSPHPNPNDSVPPHLSLEPFELLSQFWSSEQVSPGKGPLRGTPGTPEAFHLSKPQSPLLFSARGFGDFSSQHWILPGLGSLV